MTNESLRAAAREKALAWAMATATQGELPRLILERAESYLSFLSRDAGQESSQVKTA